MAEAHLILQKITVIKYDKKPHNFPATKLKDMEYYYLINKEFKIAVMKKFNPQENSSNSVNSWNKINEQKQYFNKD